MSFLMMDNPLAITPGEPAGIGPDLIIQLAQKKLLAPWVVFACPELLAERAQLLGLPLTLITVSEDFSDIPLSGEGQLCIYPIHCTADVTPGHPHDASATYVLKTIEVATRACLEKRCKALVTGPIQKSTLQSAAPGFTGHTDYLAQLAGVDNASMLFAAPDLFVSLCTVHIPLSAVPTQANPETFARARDRLAIALRRYGCASNPRIGVLGLNPHAGESGLLGTEETAWITRAIEEAAEKYPDIIFEGPLSPDAAFMPHIRERFDGLIAQYHDQALAPLKALYSGQLVNVTAGLPFLRTSVDHGTAPALAGTGRANPDSFAHAINFASTHA